MRLIDADELINILFPIARDLADEYGSLGSAVSGTIRHIQAAPTITPESLVRHGHWNGEGDGYANGEIVLDVWYCSECGHCIDDGTDDPALLPNYCPNCGAKMDAEENYE